MEYQLGDMAWFSENHIPSNRPSKKLDHKYFAPYNVVKKVGPSAHQFITQGQPTRHAMFNEQLLKPHRRGSCPSQFSAPPAKLEDEEDEWEVESTPVPHALEDYVSEDTWEPARHLTWTGAGE